MLKKQETVIIVSLVLFIFLFVYNSEISPDLYFVNFNIKDSVSCYHVSENDGLPQLVHFNPPTNSIYFHETSCRGRINSKQACSIESAARSHPKWTIHVLFSSPIHKIAYQDVNLEILRAYKNVNFLRVHLDEYCKDTPVENLYLNGALNRTRWPQRHGRDILKFITLYKWGGIYLDLETLVVNSLENLSRNWALVDGDQVSTAALALFGDYDTGVRFSYAILSTMANTYRGDVLEHNGPILMKRVLDRMCFTSDITEMTPDRCYEYLETDGGASRPSSPDRSPTPMATAADGIPADSARSVDESGTSARSASPMPPELSTTGGCAAQPADPQGLTAPTDDANTNGDIVLPIADPELLRALGDFEAETADWGPDIVADLSKRWDPILKDGLKKETREELLKRYLLPKNCPLIKAPVLNPEIAAMLNESAKNRDVRIQKKQSHMGCVLAILGRTMSGILTKSSDTTDILRLLTDATKLLSDSHYLETETRRSLVTPMVDKTFLEPFKDRKRDSHLFGEKLGEFIKSSRGIQKTGKLIQSAAQTSSLNYKGPPSRQPYHRFVRGQSRRGGGIRPGSNYRRRGTMQTPGMTRAPRASSPHQHPASRHKPAGGAPTTSAKQ